MDPSRPHRDPLALLEGLRLVERLEDLPDAVAAAAAALADAGWAVFLALEGDTPCAIGVTGSLESKGAALATAADALATAALVARREEAPVASGLPVWRVTGLAQRVAVLGADEAWAVMPARADGSPLCVLLLPAQESAVGSPSEGSREALRAIGATTGLAAALHLERRRSTLGGRDEARGVLELVESLNAVQDLQELLDRLAEAAATTAGWRVAVLSVYLHGKALVGLYGLPPEARAPWLRSMATTHDERRLAKRAQIRSLAYPGTGIAFVPHSSDLVRGTAFIATREIPKPGTWHPEDRLFILVKTGTGEEVGVLSLDEPRDGNAPHADSLAPLRLAERLLEVGASLLYGRLLAANLRRSEEAYRALVEGAPVGIWRRTEDHHVVAANPRLAEIFGYASPQALLSDSGFLGLFDPAASAAMSRAMEATGEVRDFDMKARRRDGAPIRLRVALRRDRDGQVQGIAEDVTEALQLEEHLQRTQRIEALGTLASGIAHEFNNLLAGILGYASILRQRLTSDPALLAMARSVEDSALRAADLTRSLLGSTRPAPTDASPVDLRPVVADVARVVRETFDRRIVLRTEIDEEVPEVRAVAVDLHRALLNLCINARDAMPEGGVLAVTISLDPTGPKALPAGVERSGGDADWVRIEVSDTGVGMGAEVRARLFEPFFTTKPRGKGTGLGLYGVYQVVAAVGGTVEVDSRVGEGTTVRLWLRAAGSRVARPSNGVEPATERAAAPVKGSRVLLVEDDTTVRRFASHVLRGEGYVVTEAADGEEAVQRFDAEPFSFDLLVLDLVLPRIAGTEVLRRCRALRPDMPVILSSGNVHDGLDDPEVALAVAGVLAKPYLPQDLLSAASRALSERPGKHLGGRREP